MAFIRSAEEAEKMIEELKRKTKGKYLTQAVTFNRDSERQMELLKFAFMSGTTFSGFGKELIAARMEGLYYGNNSLQQVAPPPIEQKDVGNFTLE